MDRFSAGGAAASTQGDDFVVLSRLVPYKRVDLAIAAFAELGLPLVVAGTGRDADRLRSLAPPNVRFIGHVSDAELPALLARSRALVFPGVEDFGIVPVEAMAAGTPVIAFNSGGATESVVDGRSGVFFAEPTAASLADAVRRAAKIAWDRGDIRRSTAQFGEDRFQREMAAIVADVVGAGSRR